MFGKPETIEQALRVGKRARIPAALMIFATIAEASYRLFDGSLTAVVALGAATLLVTLALLLWRVWDGRAVASAIVLLIVVLACIWIGMIDPAYLLAFLGLWSVWDGVRGVQGGLAYQRLSRSAQKPEAK